MDRTESILEYKDEMVRALQTLVAVRSVQEEAKEGMPFGAGPAKALETALDIAKELGFRTKNMDNYAGYIEMGEGEDLIGILCHVDVVPEGTGWTHPPYSAEVEDGFLYGRGVSDDKGPFIMALYAMQYVRDSFDVPLNKRVRLVIGANEESGSAGVKRYKEIEGGFTCGFSPDADFPLIFGEKGIVGMVLSANVASDKEVCIKELHGGEAANVVAPLCECVLQGPNDRLDTLEKGIQTYAAQQAMPCETSIEDDKLNIILKGVSAHAATPDEGKNAITHLLVGLKENGLDDPFVNAFVSLIATETDGVSAGLACSDTYGALTLNVGLAELTGETAKLTVNIRYPITVDFLKMIPAFHEKAQQFGITVSVTSDMEPLFVDPDSELVQTLYGAYTEVTGDTEHKPFTIGGGTYSREFENVVAFGAVFPGENARMHMPDEQLKIESMLKATEVYACAIEKLLLV